MHIFHIDSKKDVGKVDKMIKQGKDVFILVYMKGCGPCNATRPEWDKIESALSDQYSKNNKLTVIDVNKDYLQYIKHIGEVNGYPTLKYIGNHGKIVEPYENSSVKKKDRSVSSFINWIETKINKMVSTTPTSSAKHVYERISKTKSKSPHKTRKSKHNKTQWRNKKNVHNKGKQTRRIM